MDGFRRVNLELVNFSRNHFLYAHRTTGLWKYNRHSDRA